jgi:DNA invertase Pin-like site-specific DNA recombinase
VNCAVYARKSTDQSDVSEDARSVTRQIEHAKAFAAKHGWTVAEEHIFVEADATSGAVFGEHRPGLMRLLNALEPRAPFGALVMMEESRIGREQIETAYVTKQITDAGVRCFTYLDGKERTLDTAMDKVMFSLANFASEMEREKASQRVYDTMVRKAQRGEVTGGRVYGYDNLDILGPDGRRSHVIRRVNDREAAILRRLFQGYADGTGLIALARGLNAEQVPPPRGDAKGWAPEAIRDMLQREIYRGVVIWNRTQRIVRKGAKTSRVRPAAEWFRVDAPDLRIISEDLWAAAQAARRRAFTGFPRRSDGTFLGRPAGFDQGSRWLLTGLADCGVCGNPLISRKSSHARWRKYFYRCGHHVRRGTCPNAGQVRREILDGAILDGLNRVLDQRIIAAAIDEALETMRRGQAGSLDRRTQITRELSLLAAQQQKFLTAITDGVPGRTVKAGMEQNEAREDALRQELADLDASGAIASLEAGALRKEIAAQADDIRRLLGEQVPKARQMLRKLEVRVTVERFEDDGVRYTVTGTYMRIFGRPPFGRGGWPRPVTSSNGNTCSASWSRWDGT